MKCHQSIYDVMTEIEIISLNSTWFDTEVGALFVNFTTPDNTSVPKGMEKSVGII